MEFTYENIGTNTYLVYDVKDIDKIDSLAIGMLTNNKIPGISQVIFSQMDDKKSIKFNVSSTISATHIFAGVVEKKHLIGILRGVVNAYISAEEYMIGASSLLFDWDYIFTNVSTGETNLICVPLILEDKSEQDIQQSIKDLMNSLKFNQHEDCSYIATILNYINTTTDFSMTSFRDILDLADKGMSKTPASTVSNNVGITQAIDPMSMMVDAEPMNQMSQIGTPVGPMGQPVAPMGQPVGPMGQPVAPMGQPVAPMGQLIGPMSQQVAPMDKKAKKEKKKKNKNINNVQGTQPAPFAIPGVSAPATPVAQPALNNSTMAERTEEKEISLFYLLQHYNKENAETYKRQKARRKMEKAQAKQSNSNVQVVPGAPSQEFVGGNYGVAQRNIMEQQSIGQPMGQAVQPMGQPVAPMGQPVQPIPQPVQPVSQPVQPMGQASPMAPSMMGSGMNFGETTVLNGSNFVGETTVLGEDSAFSFQRNVFILRKKNGEKVQITKPIFRIGKERSYVDYYIGDNTAISRSHAEIIQRGEDYYIVDTNSTNHTYVNDLMLQSNVEAKLENGTQFRLANETFEMVITQ